MFDSNILLNFYNEIANRSALQLGRYGFLFVYKFLAVRHLDMEMVGTGRNLVSNERSVRIIRLSPSSRSLARRRG